jgi:hypothetical protein
VSHVVGCSLCQIAIHKLFIAASMSVISDKFTVIVETSPVNSKLVTSDLVFVIFKLVTHCSCCSYTLLPNILICTNNSLLFHPLTVDDDDDDGGGETNGSSVFSHLQIFNFPH